MAMREERKVSDSETSPLNDEDNLFNEEYEDVGPGCGCFRGLCFGRRGRGRYLLEQEQQEVIIRESWLRERVKRIKEFSEVVAGPKWKTFIRRLSVVTNNNNKKRSSSSSSRMHFQYDPHSYKLNFDDGINGDVDDGYVDFSARFAGPVVING